MTKNYLKPEVETISVFSEGVLAASLFEGLGNGSGPDDLTFDEEFNPWN